MFRFTSAVVAVTQESICNDLLWVFRACRLKKKAQYEANKVKLWGLSTEYGKSVSHQITIVIYAHTPTFNLDLI